MEKKHVVVVGGGTGTTPVLSGLKVFDDLALSVIVSMTDDGGSNAVVRDEFGLLPLSDLRKSIIALADSHNDLLREIFTYRFAKGEGLAGHTLGNLILMGLTDMKHGEVAAVDALSRLFRVKGHVIPVTLEKTTLVATYDDGTSIQSEHAIDEPTFDKQKRITRLELNPQVKENPEASAAIRNADYIIVGPGDLFTTTLANIIVGDIAEAIQSSSGTFIFITNLMTKRGQTDTMRLRDTVNEITTYVGREPDCIIAHKGVIPKEIMNKYAASGQKRLEDDLGEDPCVVRQDVIFNEHIETEEGDTLVRSFLRHDPDKLAKILRSIII